MSPTPLWTATAEAWINDVDTMLGEQIATTDIKFYINDPAAGKRRIRMGETNLGDFVADAYLALAWHGGIMADIGLVNGGGIRANIEPGDVTYGNLIDVQPFNNQLAYVDTLGQNILDALEVGASKLARAQRRIAACGGPHVHRAHGHSVVGADAGSANSDGVAGEYRVRNVLVNGEPLT